MNARFGKGQVAIVTGAGSGIGRGVALALLERGFDVVLAGRDKSKLHRAAQESNYCDHAHVVLADVTIESDVIDLFTETRSRLGRVDLLFNNAGIFGSSKPVDEVGFDEWLSVVNVNVNGGFLCAREAFRTMRRQSPIGGRIINNGSVSAQSPRPNSIAYTASKHALTGLTKALALEGRRWNIACGQIDIGNVATSMTSEFEGGTLQADDTVKPEPVMELEYAVNAVITMAELPLHVNVPFITIMATTMPLIGRG